MTENIFLQISVLLGITVSIALIIKLLRQPLMIAYIVAGIIAGPVFLNIINADVDFFRAFAQFGVVLLLFVVGLSLNFNYIKQVGRVSLIVGCLQLLITAPLATLLLYLLGFTWLSAFYVAIAVTFSSTIIIIKLFGDKKVLETVYGRHTVGLLLVQDIIAIIVMVLITSFYNGEVTFFSSAGLIIVRGLVVLALIYFLSRVVLPLFLPRVVESSEFLFIFTIAWCFGIASLVYWLGFSPEVGAVVAGITLGSSTHNLEISSRIRPLRDFFIILFFIILGSEMGLTQIESVFPAAIILSLFVLIIKPVILYLLFRFLKFTRRNSVLVAITSAQISEFGFILLFTARTVGLIESSELALLTLTALITIFISSYLNSYNDKVYALLSPLLNRFGADVARQKDLKMQQFDVWVIGYHRLGWKICEALTEKRVNFGVVDFNHDIILRLEERGIPAFFGDVSDVEFLEDLRIENAKLIISTIPEASDQMTLISYVRRFSKKTIIIANLYHKRFLDDLYKAGADYVMMPHLLSGEWIADILKNRLWSKNTFRALVKKQVEELKLRYTFGVH